MDRGEYLRMIDDDDDDDEGGDDGGGGDDDDGLPSAMGAVESLTPIS